MLHSTRSHAGFANVMAMLAVFVAIGGTSYAAIVLPRNSVGQRELKPRAVGSKELKRGAVTSRALRNGAVQPRDLSRSTKIELAGKPGPPGPAGQPAVSLRAAINAVGDPVAGNSNGVEVVAPNKRLIGFSRSLAGCVPTASLARNQGGDAFDPGPGRIVVALEGDRVAVETYMPDGSPGLLPFNVIVAC